MTTEDTAGLEHLARPLLELIQRLTGLETTFVTQIDWASQKQTVLVALNRAELQVPEGTVSDWPDTLCRRAILSNKECTSDVARDLPGHPGAEQLGLRTFFSIPILSGDATIGTVCGASRRSVEIGAPALSNVRLVSEAMSFQIASLLESLALRSRAEHAEALALVDPLTGLANRRGFTARLEEALASSARHDSPVAVLAIDLDHFKAVNDTYGHPGGDKVLAAAADVLRRAARLEDVSARVGGDEFALLLPWCDHAGAQAVAARVAADFRRTVGGLGMPCSLSIGVATSETSPRRGLLEAADQALYRNKARRQVVSDGPRRGISRLSRTARAQP